MGTDALDDMAYVMACVECGEGRAWPDFLCETCRLEPPTHEACPDCRAEVGVPCTWDCSSRWT